jgi:hypothetical protein
VSEQVECIGGPYDGRWIEFSGYEYKVPLHGRPTIRVQAWQDPTPRDLPEGRIGLYIASRRGPERVYVWTPTPEVRTLYPEPPAP